jgi:hypothetical protein
MADKDFEIKVKTTADTSGIKETEAGLDRINRKQAEAAAKWRASPLNPANRPAIPGGGIAALGGPAPAPVAPAATAGVDAGLLGLAGGFAAGAVTAGITAIISQFKKLNAEMDQYAEKTALAAERTRELALAIIESGEEAAKFARIRDLPLTAQIQALKYELIRVRTEFDLANQAMDTKAMAKYQQQINSLTGSLEAATEKQKKLKEQAFIEEPQFVTRAFKAADPQVKALLDARIAAERARERGEYLAPVQVREAEDAILRFRRAATPEQRAELEQLGPHLLDILNELKKQTSQWQ